MKKILISLLLIIASISVYSQYENANEYVDTITIKGDNCFLYETNQTIPNDKAETSLVRIPDSTTITSCYFDGIYYKVLYENCIGYIFCLNVITPNRISELQDSLQNGSLTPELRNSINSKYIPIETSYIDYIYTVEYEIEEEKAIVENELNLNTIYYIMSFINLFRI